MNYGTVIDDVIKAPLAMCSIFDGVGAWHTLTDEERAKHGWYPCSVLNESFNQRTQWRSDQPELSFDGESVLAIYTITDKAAETIKSELLSSLASHRFDFEVNGLVLGDGLSVKTDRESQAQLNSAYVTLKNGLIPDTDWKGGNGWQLVNLVQIEPIAKAVAAHGRGCFRGERMIQAVITDAASIAELEAINIGALFHAAYQEAFAEVMTPEQATE